MRAGSWALVFRYGGVLKRDRFEQRLPYGLTPLPRDRVKNYAPFHEVWGPIAERAYDVRPALIARISPKRGCSRLQLLILNCSGQRQIRAAIAQASSNSGRSTRASTKTAMRSKLMAAMATPTMQARGPTGGRRNRADVPQDRARSGQGRRRRGLRRGMIIVSPSPLPGRQVEAGTS